MTKIIIIYFIAPSAFFILLSILLIISRSRKKLFDTGDTGDMGSSILLYASLIAIIGIVIGGRDVDILNGGDPSKEPVVCNLIILCSVGFACVALEMISSVLNDQIFKFIFVGLKFFLIVIIFPMLLGSVTAVVGIIIPLMSETPIHTPIPLYFRISLAISFWTIFFISFYKADLRVDDFKYPWLSIIFAFVSVVFTVELYFFGIFDCP